MKKFGNTGVDSNIGTPVRHRFAYSAENIAIASESIAKYPNMSIPRRSQELGLFHGTFWRILHLDLQLHPYKV